jgi:ResB-like family
MSHSTIDSYVTDQPPPQPKSAPSLEWRALQTLASLKITVVLFALSIVLVFCGTLAMMDNGIWTVVKGYFRSFYVWIPFQVFVRVGQVFFAVPTHWSVRGGIPFPGGWTIGAALLINLFAAHIVRFKFSWRRSGILILHSGIALLLIGELITGVFAVESQMIIGQGETVNFTQRAHELELTITDSDASGDEVVAVPLSLLRKGGTVRNDALPFEIEVVRYMANSTLAKEPAKGETNPSTAGFGLRTAVVEQPEIAGVSTKQEMDAPSAYLTLRPRGGGEPIGTYLVSLLLKPQPIAANGKVYAVEVRNRRDYKPYSLTLLEFRYDRYIGTEVAKNFSSRIRLRDPERGEDREVLIRMNEPMRFLGETFYQADFNHETEKGTVLSVVRNPGWLLPYISCFLVTVGMMTHFGITLVNFLKRRAGR